MNVLKKMRWLIVTGGCMLVLSGCLNGQRDSATTNQNETDMVEDLSSINSPDKILTKEQAVIDANDAIERLNLKLLAFTNRTIHFPGVDMQEYSLEWIKIHCGVEYLQGTGDTLEIGEDTSRRAALKRYASAYNERMLKGCIKFQKDY